ncbi:MAG: chain length determinant protein tyrosine kinase EpsG [Noviherbaspirillum sp.]
MNSVHHLATVPSDTAGKSIIGAILVDWGRLTPDEVALVAQEQERQGMRFGEVAVRMGLIQDEDIRQVLAYQFDYPYLPPQEQGFSPDLLAAYDPFSPQVEMLRAIRSELALRWFASGAPALVVGSANRREGASFLAANLAVVFSQLGERTLLIDANLRRPRQQQIFGIGSRLGLSDILVGRAHLETICKLDTLGDLSVLPAGTVPPNPQELLSRPAFGELTEALGGRFEKIIVDVPAFSEGADGLTVANRLGGMLLVARANHTGTADLEFVRGRLAGTGAALVGSVLLDF